MSRTKIDISWFNKHGPGVDLIISEQDGYLKFYIL